VSQEEPKHIQAFVAGYIESVIQLEVLLVLYGSSERAWTAEALARELRIDPAWVDGQLAQLCAKGLLHCSEDGPRSYRYQPHTSELHQAMIDLSKAYADRRVSVISLIYSRPAEQPTDPLKSFSDAFRLRKDNRNG